MTQDSKNKWSVIINIALTTITAVLSALGFTIGRHAPSGKPMNRPVWFVGFQGSGFRVSGFMVHG